MRKFNGTSKQMSKYVNILRDGSVRCKCGRYEPIPPHFDKVLCSWCGNYVFKTKKDEFSYRMKGMLKK